MFHKVLQDVIKYAKTLGFNIVIRNDLDKYFKGDLDGLNIYCSDMKDEDKLFNVLHLVGHNIQWNVSDSLRKLGSKLYENPSDELLKKLQEYEWEANCYALFLLHEVGCFSLDNWLNENYRKDMLYLTHFYKTGEKVKINSEISQKYSFTKELIPKKIPKFVPIKSEHNRNGIVIDF